MKMCMVVYVYGHYTRYVPYYIYSILKSYPDYYVKVYLRNPLSANENKCLTLIREQISANFEVVDHYLDRYIDRKQPSNMVGGFEKVFRYLLPYDELKDFKYAYIGDVDFLIIRENPSLVDGHKRHLRQIGVPYSNVIRTNSKRLTGLHFIKVKDYYDKMNALIENYLSHPSMLYQDVKNLRYNEEFLYQIVEKEIGFGKIQDHHYRPPHGFHIGIMRQGDEVVMKRKVDRYFQQKQLTKQGIFTQLQAYYDDPLFKKMMVLSPDRGITFLGEQLKHYKA